MTRRTATQTERHVMLPNRSPVAKNKRLFRQLQGTPSGPFRGD
jgi:hypothetical protein